MNFYFSHTMVTRKVFSGIKATTVSVCPHSTNYAPEPKFAVGTSKFAAHQTLFWGFCDYHVVHLIIVAQLRPINVLLRSCFSKRNLPPECFHYFFVCLWYIFFLWFLFTDIDIFNYFRLLDLNIIFSVRFIWICKEFFKVWFSLSIFFYFNLLRFF